MSGLRRVVAGVSDFAPGITSIQAWQAGYTATPKYGIICALSPLGRCLGSHRVVAA